MIKNKTFNVGDKVRLLRFVDGLKGTGIIERGISDISYRVLLTVEEMEEGVIGYHVGKKVNWNVLASAMELAYDEKKEARKKELKATIDNTLSVKLERRANGKTYFDFQVPDRITKLYAERASEEKDSASWKGLKFYAIPDLLADEQYKRKLAQFNLVDDFGDGFLRSTGGRYQLNIAWIRTVGGKGEIEVKHEIGHSELNILIKNMLEFLKTYFEDYLRAFVIKGSLTIDF